MKATRKTKQNSPSNGKQHQRLMKGENKGQGQSKSMVGHVWLPLPNTTLCVYYILLNSMFFCATIGRCCLETVIAIARNLLGIFRLTPNSKDKSSWQTPKKGHLFSLPPKEGRLSDTISRHPNSGSSHKQ